MEEFRYDLLPMDSDTPVIRLVALLLPLNALLRKSPYWIVLLTKLCHTVGAIPAIVEPSCAMRELYLLPKVSTTLFPGCEMSTLSYG